MTLPKSPLLLVPLSFCITTFLASGCNIPWDDITSSGDEDEDEEEDTEGEDTEGDTEGGKPSISSAGPSGGETEEATDPWGNSGGADTEGGWDTDSGLETDSGYTTEGGHDTDGGFPTSGGCEAYCQSELNCYDYYASVDECNADCAETAASFGQCVDAFEAMNFCLGTLGCDELAAFYVGVDELINVGTAAPFPCDQTFVDLLSCEAGGSGGA